MATNVAGQEATPADGPEAAAGVPILASKITVPGVPGWAVQRPRITKLVAEGARAGPLTAVTEPRQNPPLAEELRGMPDGQTWTGPGPCLISAAASLSAHQLAAGHRGEAVRRARQLELI